MVPADGLPVQEEAVLLWGTLGISREAAFPDPLLSRAKD